MNNSILVSKVIYKVLSEDDVIKESVESRIYPLIAENDTKFPFITYSRDNIYSNRCKDGIFEDTVTFSVNVVSTNYTGSLDIANRIRHVLEKRKIESKDLTLYNIRLSGIDESYSENSYIQSLSFECTAQ